MRHRIANYTILNTTSIQLNEVVLKNEIEDIRLIINETTKKVLCSSMQKDINISAVNNDGTNTIITLKSALIATGNKLTIEIDEGDTITPMTAIDVESYFNS